MLSVSDLSDILNHLVDAYALLDRLLVIRTFDPLEKVHIGVRGNYEPLQLIHASTEHSLSLLLIGAGTVVFNLALAASVMFHTRKSYWESEKMKWQAREAEHAFRRKQELPTLVEPKAGTQVSQLMNTVNDADTISGFRLEIGDYLILEHVKTRTNR